MSHQSLIACSFITMLLVGCGSMPATSDLLVENAKGAKMFSKKDSFEVKKPVSQVAAVLKEKSVECLQLRLDSTQSRAQGAYSGAHTTSITFMPKMKYNKNHARLTVQLKDISQGTMNLGGMPPDGWYIMVVDAYPVDKHTTRVESYFQYTGFEGMYTAVKPWVTGTNTGCPDLTQ